MNRMLLSMLIVLIIGARTPIVLLEGFGNPKNIVQDSDTNLAWHPKRITMFGNTLN